MHAILKSAIEAVQRLPDAKQAEVAAEMLAYVGLLGRGQPSLNAEQLAGVREAQAAIEREEFASDEDMDAIWRSFER